MPVDSTTEQERVLGGSPLEYEGRTFDEWFRLICVPELVPRARSVRILLRDPRSRLRRPRPLSWEVCHEILAYREYSGRRYSVRRLIRMSNDRYRRLAALWPGEAPTREELDAFYERSAEVLPWGHGVFLFDHDVEGRRRCWMRRVVLLRELQRRGARSLLDFGAGGGHTSLLALALGFRRVVHHEYPVFHDYVLWRAHRLAAPAGGRFEVSSARRALELAEPVDAACCLDVAEHVADPERMLDEIARALRPGGLLVWVACFEPSIACHLHFHLRGCEEDLLDRHGFERIGDLPVRYLGHTGLYRRRRA
ncbi:MAG: SAM-dependent methyltransferase [Acidobacteria bacterium]|nr:MAG: SAM-dependent methyltransferase [Acidobacteriota bacterium]